MRVFLKAAKSTKFARIGIIKVILKQKKLVNFASFVFFPFHRQKMVWTKRHDILLCREILTEEPYQFKHGSREKGHCWDTIAKNLNSMSEEKFVVDQRAVRDRLKKLEAWHKRKMAHEEKASGISPEFTELDQAMEDIVDRTKEAQEELAAGNEKNQKCAQKEKITAEDIRKRSMESLGETKEREKENTSKKQRRKSCLEYFKEKHEKEIDLKREEIELKKREMAIREQEVANALAIKVKEEERKSKELELKKKDEDSHARNQSNMVAALQQQLQQQQAMFLEMQQQNKLLLELFNNAKK